MSNDGQYLAKLRDYYAQHRVLPSYAGIGALIGLRSKASVAEMVQRFKREGFLLSSPDRRLKPGPRFFDRFVTKSVQAGSPTATFDADAETFNIDEYLIKTPSKTIVIKVKGDSMIDAGIRDGDMLIVEKRGNAEVGDIVVAMINGEFTVKYFSRERGHNVLKPANDTYPTIRPKDVTEIIGVVMGLVRKY